MNREEYRNELKIKGFLLTFEEAYHKVSKENEVLQDKLMKINRLTQS